MRARLRERDSPENLTLVVDYKHEHWRGSALNDYMQPRTLFSPGKFEAYLSSVIPWNTPGRMPREKWDEMRYMPPVTHSGPITMAWITVTRMGSGDCLKELGESDYADITDPECSTTDRYSAVQTRPHSAAAVSQATADDIHRSRSGLIADSGDAKERDAEPVLWLQADPDSPEAFMLGPKRRRWENTYYTRWVKHQVCSGCISPLTTRATLPAMDLEVPRPGHMTC